MVRRMTAIPMLPVDGDTWCTAELLYRNDIPADSAGRRAGRNVCMLLINYRLIREHVDFLVQCQIARGMQLRHEHNDHLLFRVDRELSVEEPSPVVLAHRSEFREWALDACDAEAEPEA